LFALRPSDIDLERRRIRVDWQEHRSDRKRPKGRKRRVTMFPTVGPTGFPLLDALTRRCGEVTPDGLLFGTSTGRPISSSNWHRDVFEPAAVEAGWEWKSHDRVTVDGIVKEPKFDLTSHSLRHAFATVALDEWNVPITKAALLCGHSSRQVTERLYISAAADVLDAVGKLIRWHRPIRSDMRHTCLRDRSTVEWYERKPTSDRHQMSAVAEPGTSRAFSKDSVHRRRSLLQDCRRFDPLVACGSHHAKVLRHLFRR
jgi:hypothetical protein